MRLHSSGSFLDFLRSELRGNTLKFSIYTPAPWSMAISTFGCKRSRDKYNPKQRSLNFFNYSTVQKSKPSKQLARRLSQQTATSPKKNPSTLRRTAPKTKNKHFMRCCVDQNAPILQCDPFGMSHLSFHHQHMRPRLTVKHHTQP